MIRERKFVEGKGLKWAIDCTGQRLYIRVQSILLRFNWWRNESEKNKEKQWKDGEKQGEKELAADA